MDYTVPIKKLELKIKSKCAGGLILCVSVLSLYGCPYFPTKIVESIRLLFKKPSRIDESALLGILRRKKRRRSDNALFLRMNEP